MSLTDSEFYKSLHIAGGSPVYVPQDMRDYVFGSTNPDNITCDFTWDLTKLPSFVRLRDKPTYIQNQENTNSCVGQSIASACEIYQVKNQQPLELSPLYIYYNSRKALLAVTKAELSDTGTSAYLALGQATKNGICLEELHPQSYGAFREPSQSAYQDGKNRLITRYERIGIETIKISRNKIADAKVALACGMPVIFCMALHISFYDIGGPLNTHTKQYSKWAITARDDGYVGNHAMCIVGYDDVNEWFIVENSWGSGWGDNGYFALPYRAFLSSYDSFCIREFNGVRYQIPNEYRKLNIPTPAPVQLVIQPIPIEPVPTPIEPVPTPIEPTPVQPVIQPAPVVPVEPVPVEPVPVEPVPVEPVPVEPVPVEPAPVIPIEPVPTPIEPAPVVPVQQSNKNDSSLIIIVAIIAIAIGTKVMGLW